MADTIRVALAQTNTIVGDFDSNRDKTLQAMKKAEAAAADFVLFPELTVTSYFPEDLLLKKTFIEDNQRYLREIAGQSGETIAVVGFVDPGPAGDKIYSAAALLQRGKVVAKYHKICLPNYSVFDEKRYFAAGNRPLVFEYKDVKFGLNICEDIWVPDGVAESQGLGAGAEIIFCISASPYHMEKRRVRLDVGINCAKRTRSAVVYLNLVGGQDELVFDGTSYVVNEQGEVTAQCSAFEEDFLVTDISVAALRAFRAQDPGYEQELAGFKSLYLPEVITIPDASPTREKPELQARVVKKLQPYDEIYAALVLGTKDYVGKNNFRKVVIGLSGGIDSALTAAIAVDALGAQNVIGVLMPSAITSAESMEDAHLLARNLGIETKTVAINAVFDAYRESLRTVFGDLPPDTTEENLQARTRGNILMALSNKFGWMVLTTGNKSELSVGYATLYGDMAGGFAVIKDVPKTLVYKLCEQKNATVGREVIPQTVISKEPTAELRPNQKDRDSLPPYELLDAILEQFVEKDQTVKEIIARGFPREVVKEVARLVDVNEYKRRQAAPGIKITDKAFGKDRRMPITNKYHT